MVILSLIVAAALAVSFAVGEWLMGSRFDHPRLRDGRGYAKWGPVPVVHFIPEAFAFLFAGWALQAALGLERAYLRTSVSPGPLVWVAAVVIVVVMRIASPALQERFELPDEPEWHIWLVLVVMAASLLLGYYLPWPQF